jgi:hypothetical protein
MRYTDEKTAEFYGQGLDRLCVCALTAPHRRVWHGWKICFGSVLSVGEG